MADGWQEVVDVPANLALVYTECARIWNPIHTDLAVARGAGLAAPILHGTATLALAVSRAVARELGRRARVASPRSARASPAWSRCPRPSPCAAGASRTARVAFDAIGPDGRLVLSQGVLIPCNR